MKIKLLIFLVLGIIAHNGMCQEKDEYFLPGKIVVSDGDTIAGFLIYELDWQLKDRVKFSATIPNENIKEYRPNEIVGFKFESGRTFKSIKAENDSTLVFGKLLLVGKINLFVVRTKNIQGDYYYLQREDLSLTLKISPPKKTEVLQEGENKVMKDKKYINLINRILNSYDERKDLKYKEKSIIDLIKEVNKDEGYSEVPYVESIEMTGNISVGLGVFTNPNTNNLRISGYVLRQKIERTTSVSLLSGISYRFWNRRRESLEFRGNLGNGSIQEKIQRINLIPVGIHVQRNSKSIVSPYFYSGVGLAIVWDSWRIVENYVITDNTVTRLRPSFVFENCIGLRFKLGSKYLYTELTGGIFPTNLYCNVGLSF